MKKYRKILHDVEAIQILEQTPSIFNLIKFGDYWIINTLEGEMKAKYGDYLVRGIEGEYYPVKKSIFEKSYEEVKDEKI